MKPERADAHIHLFEGGYRGGSFTARPGVRIDEPECYQSLAVDHGVSAALVVGYASEPWCLNNNDYIAEVATRYEWVRPIAFAALDRPLHVEDLERWARQNFIGVSVYCFSDADKTAIARISDEVWAWLAARRWLISVNSRGSAWRAWIHILERHSELRLLVSHLGLPPRMASPPASDAARVLVADVLSLAKFPQVHVKLSGFYALSEPGYDFPHRAAWPYVESLWNVFGSSRLLWGSDFSPCLDLLTYPQTLGVIDAIPFFTDAERAGIRGANLHALLSDVRPANR